ncbi:hypothetical protein HMPREF9123_0564 [Neisseria bacilliformis ATCC BAA-1200]|uniref:Uncharacterized protein n=1 Tax=Neisseria bacilliformis ATCC BAA-1200 TaxID=888742 RepID=F2B9W5_9NEIS|nr:hypothetical protein HMPREF9123_0564 [Neisseria bacilliformis ATCC BAA-1200]
MFESGDSTPPPRRCEQRCKAFQLPWEKYSSEIKEEIYGVAAPCRITHTVCGLLPCIFLLLFHYKIAVFQE